MAYGTVFPVRADQRFLAAWASDRGRVREQNEDACLADAGFGLFVVADGMGGARAGAVASEAVTTRLPQLLGQRLGAPGAGAPGARARGGSGSGPSPALALRDGIIELSAGLRRDSRSNPELAGLGSTVVLALVRGDEVHVAHLGDSRAYWFHRGTLRRLTKDHSVIRSLVRSGKVAPEDAAAHPQRSQLTRYVGMEGTANPDLSQVVAASGARLLLCSDGLTSMLADEVIAQRLGLGEEPETTCRGLVAAANAAGGLDNVTVLIVEFAGGTPPSAGKNPAR
ncbi:MAG: serine/threonine-protein phosphatase [Planctomycetes bacterium]|nr:serine/threonine-protein phosphatase [Planctomycetota bacterium]